jgi:hypothetical protein
MQVAFYTIFFMENTDHYRKSVQINRVPLSGELRRLVAIHPKGLTAKQVSEPKIRFDERWSKCSRLVASRCNLQHNVAEDGGLGSIDKVRWNAKEKKE